MNYLNKLSQIYEMSTSTSSFSYANMEANNTTFGNTLHYTDEDTDDRSETSETQTSKPSGIVNKVLDRWSNLSPKKARFWSFMLVLTGVYFACETLQSSTWISESHHYANNTTSFAYNLLFIWLINFFLLSQQGIATQNKGDNLFYWLFANIGGIGFALLGEVPYLTNIVITSGWWKHLSISAWICVGIIALTIIGIWFIELRTSWKDGRLRSSFLSITLIGAAYGVILSLLIIGNAANIHYHVHHAIFAGALSMWFTDWKKKSVMLMHGVLMGVVVEGINFYGLGELFLFLTKGSVLMSFDISLSILIFFYFLVFISYVFSLC